MYHSKKTMAYLLQFLFFPPFSVKYYDTHFDHVLGFSVGVSNVLVVVLGFELVVSFRILKKSLNKPVEGSLLARLGDLLKPGWFNIFG